MSNNDCTVQTECGTVMGEHRNGAYVFKGIPYAAAPVGQLRWQEPVALKKNTSCWSGVYQAKRFSSVCAQQDMNNDFEGVIGSEDCLYLNVWTPTINQSANLPVMVFIHGGSLNFLGGSTPGYYPNEELVANSGIVFVNFNYRLNAFGFMALDILSQESSTKTSGNYGFRDQIMAMQWVHDNIKNFGGNPQKVTLFGHSSGATSVYAHLVSPLTEGLFQRAWMMSSSVIFNKTLADAAKDNLVFLENTGCKDVKCLRDLSPDKVLTSIPWEVYPSWGALITDLPDKNRFYGAIAIVDGIVVPNRPFDMWQSGRGHDVPVVVGTTAQEIDFAPVSDDISNWTWDTFDAALKAKLDPFEENITEQAKVLYPETGTPEYVYTTMVSDLRVGCPNDVLSATAAAALQSSVYRYITTSRPSQPVSAFKPFKSTYAFHGWDCFAFFDTLGQFLSTPSKEDVKFSKKMQELFLGFARDGKMPAEWQPFPESTALIATNLTTVKRYHAAECDFWTKHGFFSYAWIN
ncbi:neurotactin-like [Glandiceps talaboti]